MSRKFKSWYLLLCVAYWIVTTLIATNIERDGHEGWSAYKGVLLSDLTRAFLVPANLDAAGIDRLQLQQKGVWMGDFAGGRPFWVTFGGGQNVIVFGRLVRSTSPKYGPFSEFTLELERCIFLRPPLVVFVLNVGLLYLAIQCLFLAIPALWGLFLYVGHYLLTGKVRRWR